MNNEDRILQTYYPNDLALLYSVSRDTTREEVVALDLKDRLIQAMRSSWTQGLGLAAIQIGIPIRYAFFMHKGHLNELINPKITMHMGSMDCKEGCLSIKNEWLNVKRYYEIEYTTGGKNKRAKGLKAQVIQHEIDHMDGILITNREEK